MSDFNEEKFNEFWKKTEVIREYHRILYTFGDMKLPYIFLAEHNTYSDRTIVCQGVVHIAKPNILLPGSHQGPHFADGFENADAMPDNAAFLMRSMGLPYSEITNRIVAKEGIEYGKLGEVIERLGKKLEKNEDSDTGLIKGLANGVDISLMRYSLGLMIKSAPENVKQFIDHIRRQRGEPIMPNEKITDEDIQRLFG